METKHALTHAYPARYQTSLHTKMGYAAVQCVGLRMDNGNGAAHFRGFETYLIFVVVFHPSISSLAAIVLTSMECTSAGDGKHQTNTDPPSDIRIPGIKECQPRHKHNYPLIHLIHPPLNIIPDPGPSSKHFTKGGISNPYT
jgi:hypothetical protein